MRNDGLGAIGMRGLRQRQSEDAGGVFAQRYGALDARGLLAMAFFLIPFFRPTIVNDWSALAPVKTLFALWLALACLYSAYRFVARNGRIGLFLTGIVGFLFVAGASTFIKDGSWYSFAINSMMLISPCFFAASLKREELLPLAAAGTCIVGGIVLLNQALILLVPDGIYLYEGSSRWILESGSLQSRWCFLLLFFAALWDLLRRGRLSGPTLVFGIVSFATICTLGSATSLVAFGIQAALLAFLDSRHAGGPAHYRLLNCAVLAVFVLIVILRVADYLPYADIAEFLGKDLTYQSGKASFTGRTYIWDSVIGSICESPLIGYGWQDYVASGLMQFYYVHDYDSAHNLWLQVTYMGGIVGLVFFVLMYLSACARASSLRHARLRLLVFSTLAAFLVTSMFEQILTSQFLLFLALASSPAFAGLSEEASVSEAALGAADV